MKRPFLVVDLPQNGREFRVYSKDPSWNNALVLFPVLTAVLWNWAKDRHLVLACLGILLAGLLYNQSTQVLWESVFVLPGVGLRLETHRGLLGQPLFASRNLIPMADLMDLIINEGLRRWDVRFYLAAITKEHGTVKVHVAYENLLPKFPILHQVYLGTHELLFPETREEDATERKHSSSCSN